MRTRSAPSASARHAGNCAADRQQARLAERDDAGEVVDAHRSEIGERRGRGCAKVVGAQLPGPGASDRGRACGRQPGGVERRARRERRGSSRRARWRRPGRHRPARPPLSQCERERPEQKVGQRRRGLDAALSELRQGCQHGSGIDLPGDREMRNLAPGFAHLGRDQLAEALALGRSFCRALLRQPACAWTQSVRPHTVAAGARLGDGCGGCRSGRRNRVARELRVRCDRRRRPDRVACRDDLDDHRARRARSRPPRTGDARADRPRGSRDPSSPCRSRSRRRAR